MAGEVKRTTRTKKSASAEKAYLNDDGYPFHCTSCGKGFMRQKDNFNVSPSPYYARNNGYLPICKRCLEKSFDYYTDDVFNGDQDKAMDFLCATINTCFDETAWTNAKKSPPNKSRVSAYFSKLNLAQTKGASYADTILLRRANKVENATSVQQVKDNPKIEVPIETIRLFGLGFSEQDYEVLKFEYDDWVSKYGEPEDKRQDALYKSICYLKLQLQKSVQNGDAGIGALAKTYKEYINAATTELEDRKQKKEDSVKLDPLGVWISDIEKYTPAEYYKDKDLYRDADGIGGYASRFIFRPLKNLLTGSKELDKEFNLSKED